MHEQGTSKPVRQEAEPESTQRPAGQSCPACRAEADAGNLFCPQCGNGLDSPKASTPDAGQPDAVDEHGTSSSQEARQPDSSPEIPAHLPPVGRKAPAPAAAPPQKKTQACKGCGHPCSEGAKFCDQCGGPIGEVTPRYQLVGVNAAIKDMIVHLSGEELTMGKAPECQFAVPDDDYASRLHARIFRSDGKLFLEDLRSSNGTFLRVRRPMALEVGDEIAVGTSLVRLEEVAVQEASAGESTCPDQSV